jgi:hypothetical protein
MRCRLNIPRDDWKYLRFAIAQACPFRPSVHYRSGFLGRVGSSAHMRRPSVKDALIAAFLARMEFVMATYAPTCVFNMDETNWRLINQEISTIANIGADGVEWPFQREPRKCLAAIASVDAAGEKVHLWVLWTGKTKRCEERSRNDPRLQKYIRGGELVLTHQPNGSTSALVASDYLHWLYSRIQRGPLWCSGTCSVRIANRA